MQNFKGWNLKKIKQLEDWGMGQVASKKNVV